MNAILLSLTLLGQSSCARVYNPVLVTTAPRSSPYWPYRNPIAVLPPPVYKPVSPWNIAVAQLRAQNAARKRPLSQGTIYALQELAAEKERLWAALLESEPPDKDDARKQYLAVKKQLERARLLASRELR